MRGFRVSVTRLLCEGTLESDPCRSPTVTLKRERMVPRMYGETPSTRAVIRWGLQGQIGSFQIGRMHGQMTAGPEPQPSSRVEDGVGLALQVVMDQEKGNGRKSPRSLCPAGVRRKEVFGKGGYSC